MSFKTVSTQNFTVVKLLIGFLISIVKIKVDLVAYLSIG